MGINQTYAVFGLGRYGRSVAKELAENGAEVVAVDNREAVVNAQSQRFHTVNVRMLQIRKR